MNSKLITILKKLTSTQNPTQIPPKARLINGYRNYYTRGRRSEGSLYAKISPLGNPSVSVKPHLDDWVHHGKKVSVASLLRIIHDFRKRSRFSQALEVSEWMNEKELCKFTPTEHAVHLDLIGRVRGFMSAETYFNSLSEVNKTEKTYGALLNCYVRQRQVDKSLSHLQKMKEKGLASTPLTYNDIMCLYTNIGQYEKVPDVLAEMKENKILPDNYSYRLCMNSYGVRWDYKAMEDVLIEMETQPHMAVDWNSYAVAANFYIKAGLVDKAVDALRRAEVRLDNKDGTGYNHLISLNAKLARKDEILRLWELEKSSCKRCLNRDFVNVLESLVKIDAVEEAEDVLKDWESSGNCYTFRIPNIVIVGYVNKGLFGKAEAMLEALMEGGKVSSPNTWELLAKGYEEKGEMQKAIRSMKWGLAFYEENKGWSPNKKFVACLLSWLGDHGSVEDATSFVELLRKVVPVNIQMYHALMKANVRYGNDVNVLLEKMRADKVDEDGETKKIENMIQKNI